MSSKEIKALVKKGSVKAVWRYGYTTWGYDDLGNAWEDFFVSTSLDSRADAIVGQNALFKRDGRAKKYPGIKCTDASLASVKVTIVNLYSGECQEIIPEDQVEVYEKWYVEN